ncbi:AraC family transcriptional regulator [Ottowia sp.]|uniref:AraC family transcriptional regulator n=1 Tax=Ottowia sp. TaxID=1898956 RepID=UPI002CF73E00|nr:AraC family transcriptional regulator [Ottowia sp.]HMM73342.1 AraC family transcriptional regulator [Rhodocyclaceae bacterium]HRN76301.1 AraC family transcriptional regulator [Ottowia sp.]HRQ03558.1 AraC family transcriptional regulator [Ottowia sp.]
MAELPHVLIDPTGGPVLPHVAGMDVLSRLLRDIRVSRCVQFCFEPYGEWMVDAASATFRPPGAVCMHIVVEGSLWLDMGDHHQTIQSGDVVILPRGSQHLFGAGTTGRLLNPGDDMPPPPWDRIPTLTYEASGPRSRMLCGFIEARVLDFQPLLAGLPDVMVARTTAGGSDFLMPAVARLIREIDEPSPGGMTIVSRLSEIIFIELLRRQMLAAKAAGGWLGALGDPVLYKALRHLHERPDEHWTQQNLAEATGVSKTVLCQHFQSVLNMSPMRYLREWKLYLASAELTQSAEPIIRIAERAGYGTEAAFCRAFARHHGMPPAKWRKLNGVP